MCRSIQAHLLSQGWPTGSVPGTGNSDSFGREGRSDRNSTPTGIRMERDYTQKPCGSTMSVTAIFQQLTVLRRARLAEDP